MLEVVGAPLAFIECHLQPHEPAFRFELLMPERAGWPNSKDATCSKTATTLPASWPPN